ncbi:MAG: 30S ribosomal protein S16 [Patescibacteria group bacterium]
MLSIRMQRLGRKGYPTYRMVVQDKRQTPTSGKVIAMLGSYNPHTKEVTLDKDVATKFLTNGAHPSPRAVALLKSQGVAIPKWVKSEKSTQKSIKNI